MRPARCPAGRHHRLFNGVLALLILVALITPAQACLGDCDADGHVLIHELVRGVNVLLGQMSLSTCVAGSARQIACSR